MTIRVYWNTHRNLFSIQTRVMGRWKVTNYAHNVMIRDATFRVQESGWLRAVQSGQRNVHAFIEGTWVGYDLDFTIPPRVLRYTLALGKFVDRDDTTLVTQASLLRCSILANGKPYMEYLI